MPLLCEGWLSASGPGVAEHPVGSAPSPSSSLQAAAQAGPPAATVRGEAAALPDPPVGAADLRGASRQFEEGAERYAFSLPPPNHEFPAPA